MSSRNVKFQSLEWLPIIGDAKSILFRYSIVDTAFVGSVDESSHIQNNDVTIKISRNIEKNWKLEQTDLEKVLFEYGKRHVAYKVKTDTLIPHEQIDLQTYTTPIICPYDPNKITISFGKSSKFPIERPFGFHAS